MNSLSLELINRSAARWAEIIWAISWQFCCLGLVVLVIHWSLRRAAPTWRYWLWQILAIKLLLMPFWTAAAPWKGAGSDSGPVPMATVGGQAESQPTPVRKSVKITPAVVHEPGRALRAELPVESGLAAKAVPERDAPSLPQAPRAVAIHADPVAAPVTAKKVATAPLPITVSNPVGVVQNRPAPTVSVSPSVRQATPGFSWQAGLMLAWLLGVCWYVLQIVRQGAALSRRLRDAEPADPQLVQRVRDSAAQLGMSRVPEVLILDQDISPFVCGMWHTRLVMPRAVPESFAPEQLDLVLLHELAHVRRRDLIWGWIPEIGRVLFFFHPLVHVVCNQIRFERELACDQLAMLSSGRDAATYAETLVRVVGQSSGADSFRLAAVENSSV